MTKNLPCAIAYSMSKLYTKAFVEKIDKNEIIAIASSDVEDRQGESVDVGGWELENFKNAPRLLWGHDHQKLPVGKVSKIWVEKSAKPKLMFKAEFQTVTDFGKSVKKLFEEGFLNTFSVGFKPIDSEHDEDVKSGIRFTKQELLEISVVNVPANPEALTLAYKSLQKDGLQSEANKVFGDNTASLISEIDKIKNEMNIVKQDVDSAVKGLKFLNPQKVDTQRAKDRAFMLKVIAKAADKELSTHKHNDPTARRVKVIKMATDNLIRANKEEL